MCAYLLIPIGWAVLACSPRLDSIATCRCLLLWEKSVKSSCRAIRSPEYTRVNVRCPEHHFQQVQQSDLPLPLAHEASSQPTRSSNSANSRLTYMQSASQSSSLQTAKSYVPCHSPLGEQRIDPSFRTKRRDQSYRKRAGSENRAHSQLP